MRDAALLAGRIFLGVVFAYAGISKLLAPSATFQAYLEQIPYFPDAAAPVVSRLLPWAEWLTGMFLVSGYWTRIFARVAGFFSVIFMAVLAAAWVGGKGGESCGCFGGGITLSVRQALALDIGNAVLACVLALCRCHPWSCDAWLLRPEKDSHELS